MSTEIEATFPDITKTAVRQQLHAVGAVQIHPEYMMHRRAFDIPEENAWVRVRQEYDRVTMSYKCVYRRDAEGTKETTIEVDDFESACTFLTAIGLSVKAYQETQREEWQLDDVYITVDTWPWIPPFVEIEGPTPERVKQVAHQLGFQWEQALFGSVENIYQRHYNVTEEEVDSWPEITFAPVPEWLKNRQKT